MGPKTHTFQQHGSSQDGGHCQCDPTVGLTPRGLPEIDIANVEQVLDANDIVVDNVLGLGGEHGFQRRCDILATALLEDGRDIGV